MANSILYRGVLCPGGIKGMVFLSRIFISTRFTNSLAKGCVLLSLAVAAPVSHAAAVAGHITLLNADFAGVNVTISGPLSTSASSDDKGLYSFSDLPAGKYTITPSLQDYVFDPASVTVTLTSNQQQEEDFRACHEGEALTGTLYDTATLRPVPGQTVTVEGLTATTGADGTYSIAGLTCGTHIVTATVPTGYFTLKRNADSFISWLGDIGITRLDSVFGHAANSYYAGQGVNTATGNYTLQATDMTLPGIGMPFEFKRTYNSQAASAQNAVDGPLGYGWTDAYNLYIEIDADTLDATVHRGDGHSEVFINRGSAGYFPQYGVFDQLTQEASDGSFTLTDQGTTYHFTDINGRYLLHTITDLHGNTITLTYNSGLLTTIRDTVNRDFTVSNDNAGHITEITGPNGRTVQFAYDTVGNLTDVTDTLLNTTHYDYDGQHRLTDVIDARHVTSVRNHYDTDLNAVDAQYDAKGAQTRFSYDLPRGQTIVTDPLINSNTFGYDLELRAVGMIDANGNISYRGYDADGDVSFVTDSNGHTTTYTYDQIYRGVLRKITDALGNETTISYNGNTKTITDPLGHQTTTTFDSQGDITDTTDAAGDERIYTYNTGNGQLTGGTIPETAGDRSFSLAYDQENISSLTDQAGKIFTYTYNSYDALASITIPNVGVMNLTHDALGRVTSLGMYGWSYDAVGNLTLVTKPDSGTISNTFDNLNDLTQVSSGATTYQYQYDDNANLTQIKGDTLGIETYTYDSLNRVATATGPFGNSVNYDYYPGGYVKTLIYPGNKQVDYQYDALDHLTAVTDWLNQTTTYSYDAAGRLENIQYPNGVVSTYTYDDADRLTGLTHTGPGGKTLASYELTRDNAGDVAQEVRDEPLLPIIAAVQDHDYAYSGDNHLSSIDTDSSAVSVGVNGDTTALGTSRYSYDFLGDLTQVVRGDTTMTYKYDGLGFRRVRDVNGTETRYILDVDIDPPRVLAETDASGKITAYYVYGLGLVSRIDAAGDTHFYHFDTHGDTVILSDATGKQTDAYAYGPYGQELNHQGTTPNPFTFLGQFGVMDEGDGLYFAHKRYYAADLGRFLTRDPDIKLTLTDSQSFDLYTYGKNNPFINRDPSGGTPAAAINGTTEAPRQHGVKSFTLPSVTVPSVSAESLPWR